MITQDFARWISNRTFRSMAAPGAYSVGLATDCTLTALSKLADIPELTATSARGYARQPITNYALGAQGNVVTADVSPFTNTHPDDDWPEVMAYFVVAMLEGAQVLCWWEYVSPGIVAAPGDTIQLNTLSLTIDTK